MRTQTISPSTLLRLMVVLALASGLGLAVLGWLVLAADMPEEQY